MTGNTYLRGFEQRSFDLRPTEQWSSKYIIPAGTVNTNYPSFVYLYNTNTSPLAITYTDGTGSGTLWLSGTNGLLAHQLPLDSGTLLESTNGIPFIALCTMDTVPVDIPDTPEDPFPPRGSDQDWGFSPLPFEGLSTEVVCGWGPGADMDGEDYNGTQNGSPVWVMALAAATTTNIVLYVDYGRRPPGSPD